MNVQKGWPLALLLLLACSCQDLFSPDLDDLLTAAERIVIAGRTYTLETDLYRDFMPPSPPDGQPLTAIIRVTAEDRNPFPATLDADRVWVINGKEVWEESLLAVSSAGDPERRHQLEKIARGGPKWGPGIYVAVVVRVIENSGRDHLLRASRQFIARTD